MLENRKNKETEIHVCAAGVGSTDHGLIWTEIQQTRIMKNRRDRKLHRWRTDTLQVEEKQQELQKEIAKNADRVSELFESIGTAENYTERDIAGARIIEGWEKLVKNTTKQ